MNDFKHRIDALCDKVIAAPDDSEELKRAIAELRNALSDHAHHLRRQVADLRQKGVSLVDDLAEG